MSLHQPGPPAREIDVELFHGSELPWLADSRNPTVLGWVSSYHDALPGMRCVRFLDTSLLRAEMVRKHDAARGNDGQKCLGKMALLPCVAGVQKHHRHSFHTSGGLAFQSSENAMQHLAIICHHFNRGEGRAPNQRDDPTWP